MPSDPPSPAQWNLHGWMAAYQEAQRRGTPVPTSPNPPVANPPETGPPDNMQGGWRFEGKEQPQTPKICEKCQWVRQKEESVEPERGSWCEACIAGEPGIGHPPEKHRPAPVSKLNDVHQLNQNLFG